MLFFSLNDYLVNSFERYVRFTEKEFKQRANFKILRENKLAIKFEDPAQLQFLLEDKQPVEIANLILIIDIYESKNKTNFKDVIQDIVIQYPEIKILFISFNDDWVSFFPKVEVKNKKEDGNGNQEMTEDGGDEPSDIKIEIEIEIPSIHSFNPFEKNAFRLAVNGKVNLFDASNLRNYLKRNIFSSIETHTNYQKLQYSRASNLALTIDEERHQTFFNSYALYKYGYRVIPIITFNELYYYRTNISKIKDNLKLIIRDYDLQFEDYDEIENIREESDKKLNKKNILDHLRGCKVNNNEVNESAVHTLLNKENCCKVNNNGVNEANLIWDKFEGKNLEIHFVTRIPDLEDNSENEDKDKDKENISVVKEFKFNKIQKELNKNGIYIDKENNQVYLRGINKPVDGFQELLDIGQVKKRVEDIIDIDFFTTKRDGNLGSHSVSPKILHIGEALLHRSEKYFENKMYILSALLAQEALEVLNGFHFLVMLNAVYQKAISETYIETESLGIKNIGEGTKNRFQEIKLEVKRICRNNKEAEKNVLSQIFNDLRHIYKEKEQFDAADDALREFVSLNHKISYDYLSNNFKKFFENAKSLIWDKLKSIRNNLIEKTKTSNNWFKDFGWTIPVYFAISFILFLLTANCFHNLKIFSYSFLIFNFIIILLFAFHPKLHLVSLVYVLVGRTPSLKWLFTSFVIFQLFYSMLIFNYLNFSRIDSDLKGNFLDIIFNVSFSSLSNQPSPEFSQIIEYSKSNNKDVDIILKNEKEGFFILINSLLLFSYVYLGIFISTLYQKLKKE